MSTGKLASMVVMVAIAVFAIPRATKAVPAGLPVDTLIEQSDLVGIVEVLNVDAGQPGQKDTTFFRAKAKCLEVKKGSPKIAADKTIEIGWTQKKADDGSWVVAFAKGEKVKAYLKWDVETKVYVGTWINAKVPLDPEKPIPVVTEKKELKVGEIITVLLDAPEKATYEWGGNQADPKVLSEDVKSRKAEVLPAGKPGEPKQLRYTSVYKAVGKGAATITLTYGIPYDYSPHISKTVSVTVK